MKIKLSPRARAGILLICGLVLFRYGLIPFYHWRAETVQEIKMLQHSVARKKAMVGREKQIALELKQAESAFTEAAKFYYRDFTDTRALQLKLQKELERLSQTCGVKIKSSDWLYPTEGYIVQVPIKIECDAATPRIIKFIHALESAGHFFTIDQLDMIARHRTSTLNVRMVVSAYQLMKEGGPGE